MFNLSATAQIFPSPDAKLHYRVIPFSLPVQTNASHYSVHIAKGNYADEALFKKNISIRKKDSSSIIIVEVPSFAADYTWQWSFIKKGKIITSPLFHFSTLKYLYTDSAGNLNTRMNVSITSKTYHGAKILTDCTRTMYDMNGKPIWFVPESICPALTQGAVQDLKITNDGTFTFIYNAQAYEIDYFGKIITRFTSQQIEGAKNDVFHHDLTKLKNGNFMVLANELVYHKYDNFDGKNAKNAKDSTEMYRQLNMGTLLEFDSDGNLHWQWKSYDYFKLSDLATRINDSSNIDVDFHLNAFSFNEEDNKLYVGFRNISRIVKIQYPSGLVQNSYGNVFKSSKDISKNDLFCYQHSISADRNNSFYVFNNNACNEPSTPELIYFSEIDTVPGLRALNEIRKYKFSNLMPTQQFRAIAKPGFGRVVVGNRGGSFNVLDSSCYFISLNAPYNHLLIIDKSGSSLWSSIIEIFNEETKKWSVNPTYRSCFISKEIFSRTLLNSFHDNSSL